MKDKKEAEFLLVIKDEQTNVEQEVEDALNNSFGNSLDMIPDNATKQSAYVSDYGVNHSEKKMKNVVSLSAKQEDAGLSEPEPSANFKVYFKNKNLKNPIRSSRLEN